MLYLGVSDTHDKQLTILEALTRKFTLHPDLSLRRIAEGLPFTYTGADLYALCSDAMLKAITRQAQKVEQQVQQTRERLGKDITTGWWFDHEATPEDTKVLVEEIDFLEAGKELVGSVRSESLVWCCLVLYEVLIFSLARRNLNTMSVSVDNSN